MWRLTAEEHALVAEVTSGGTLSTETTLLISNACVSHANLQRLQTGATLHDSDKYLDDEIINRYLTHCLTQEDEHISSNVLGLGRKRSYFFNSFFVQTMFDEKNSNPNLRGHYHYKNVERWLKKVHDKDIFNMKYIFVPIN
jgi:Ulp1 family protease